MGMILSERARTPELGSNQNLRFRLGDNMYRVNDMAWKYHILVPHMARVGE